MMVQNIRSNFLLHLTKLRESFFISFVSDFPSLEMTKMTENEVVFWRDQ